MTLNPKQQRFVEEYLIDLNATQAAIRAGYSAKTAQEQASRLLSHVMVAEAVRDAQEARSKRTGVTADRVLAEMAAIGFSRINKVVRWKANVTGMQVDDESGEERMAVTNEVQLVDAADMDDDTLAAVAEISQSDKGGLKIKLHDKMSALNAMGKHLGMFVERHEVTGKNGGPIETREMTDQLAALPQEKRDALRAAIKGVLEN